MTSFSISRFVAALRQAVGGTVRRLLALVLLTSAAINPPALPLALGLAAPASAPALSTDKLPLYFVENRGQTDPRVAFYVPGQANTLFFTPDGLTLALTAAPARRDTATQSWAVKLDFVGANPAVRPVGERPTAAVFSYFTGQPSQWLAGLPSFAQLRYPNLWPGIDLVYSGQVNRLKYEFVVQPGADPAQIRLAYRGASAVRLTADGELEVSTPLGSFRDAAPVAYQVKDGRRAPVEMLYAPQAGRPSMEAASYAYGFELGAYDPALPLVLDPEVVMYAGYIGGLAGESASGIAVDSAGNAYVTGPTFSDENSFPVGVGPDLTKNVINAADTFVAKVNAAGTALIYAGYIGGSGEDIATGIAVDSAGNAYVIGHTYSPESNFPVTVGPDLSSNGQTDAFIAKVNSAGTALVYAGYIGGSLQDYGRSIAVDGAGNAYVTGDATSDQNSFPVLGGPDLTHNGSTDAFVAKVKADGSGLTYAGYIGGAGADVGYGIAVDGGGNAYITGQTASDQSTFPEAGGPDLTYNGADDAFVVKVNAAGSALIYAGYLGGDQLDRGEGMAVDSNGNAYLTGYTGSAEATFPEVVGPDLSYNGGQYTSDAFVAKVNAAGSALTYAGYIGGSDADYGHAIAVDALGYAYVAGHTWSNESTFPVTGGPDLTHNGSFDAFVAKLNPSGATLAYATYFGGAVGDASYGIALDGWGNAYITGYTTSNQSTFPDTVGPDLTYNGGGGTGDAFVAKIGTPFVPTEFIYLPVTLR